MMKTLLLVLAVSLMVGCSSKGGLKEDMSDGAAICNEICKNNSEISEYSSTAGGGIPLLFMGGMEVKCSCNRTSK